MSVFSPQLGHKEWEGNGTARKAANKYAGDGIKSRTKDFGDGEREFLRMNKTEVSPPTPTMT